MMIGRAAFRAWNSPIEADSCLGGVKRLAFEYNAYLSAPLLVEGACLCFR